MNYKIFLLVLILFSFVLKAAVALNANGFGVDESLYLTLAKKFALTGEYGMKTEFNDENFVAPFFPVTMSVLYKTLGESGALLASPLFSSLTILPIYFLARKLYDEKIARISSLVFLANPAAILLATRPLTESYALLLFSASLLFMFLSNKNRKFLVFFTPLAFLASITRYQLVPHLIVLFAAFAIYKKDLRMVFNKWFLVSLAVTLFIASPWIYYNMGIFGNPLGGIAHQGGTDAGFSLASMEYLLYLAIVAGPVFPFAIYGIYTGLKKRKQNWFVLLSFAVLFAVQFFGFGKNVELRYLFHLIPIMSIASAAGFEKVYSTRWKVFVKIFFGALLVVGIAGALMVLSGLVRVQQFVNFDRYADTKQAALWMDENCKSPVMSNGFAYIWYYTKLDDVSLHDKDKNFQIVQDRNISCIMMNTYEAPYEDFFAGDERFELAYTAGKVLVYRPKLSF